MTDPAMHDDALPGCEGVLQLSELFTKLLNLGYAAVRCGEPRKASPAAAAATMWRTSTMPNGRMATLANEIQRAPGGPSGDFLNEAGFERRR
jgi:hypothetical protein